MKLLPTLVCSAVFGVLTVVAPQAAADQQLALSMCDYVAADDKNRLRKVLSDNRLRLRNIYDGVVCNGESLIRHAFRSNAADVGEFMVKQLPAASVSASGDIAWAETNGFGSSPLLAVLRARTGESD